jgi:hypothetical protein
MEAQPNPYAPPEAPVSDPDAPAGPCPHVELASRLLWISFGISLLDDVMRIIEAPPGIARVAGIVGGVIGTAVGAALLYWITSKLRAGRNWMRWLYTALNVMGWLSMAIFWDFFLPYFRALEGDWLAILSAVLQTIAGFVAVLLLHTTTSREWFRARGSAAA